jgi:hypothetical protein
MHDHLGEEAFETPSIEILHQETDDKFFGKASRRDCSLMFELFLAGSSTSSVDPATSTTPWAASVTTMVMLSQQPGRDVHASLVSYSDLIDVLSMMCIVHM